MPTYVPTSLTRSGTIKSDLIIGRSHLWKGGAVTDALQQLVLVAGARQGMWLKAMHVT